MKAFIKTQNPEAGLYLIEFLVVLVMAGIIGTIAMTSMTKIKEIATKKEMDGIALTINLYETMEGSLPNNLNKLGTYMTSGYKTDSFGASYIYDKSLRRICTPSIDVDPSPAIQYYCKSF